MPDPDLDDAPIRPATGPGRRKRPATGPVVEAYADITIERACPGCGAEANSWCVHPSGAPRRIPCPNR